MKYGPHKSTIFELDANIAALLIYIVPMLSGFLGLSLVAWVIPLIALYMENYSSFVRFHAANSLSFYIISAILSVISSLLGLSAMISSWIFDLSFIGIIAVGITGILMFIFGLLFLVIHLFLFVGQVISAIKAYNYEEINFPIIYTITSFILKSKR